MIFITSRLIEFLFYCLLALNLSKCWQSNVFSLGIQGYYLLGSYFVVLFSLLVNQYICSYGLLGTIIFFIFSIFGAGFLTLLISKLFFHVFRKLKDDYFAIATLAFSEILIIAVSNIEFLGGAKGVSLNNTLVFSSAFSNKIFFLIVIAVVFIFYLTKLVKANRSMENLTIRALSENDIGVQHLGINTERVRKKMFSQSGFWVGLGGAIMTQYYISISPENYSFISSIPILLFVVIGNFSLIRTILFSFVIYSFYELFKINFGGILPISFGNALSGVQGIFYGLLLICSVQYINYRKAKSNA